MTDDRMNAMLSTLRSRVESGRPELSTPIGSDELARAIHELDVYHAELEIQNQDLLASQVQLSEARDKYQVLFDGALTPLFSVSAQGVVLEANRAMLALSDRPRERLVGRPFVVCLAPSEPQRYFEHLQAVRESGREQQVELVLRQSTGALRQVVMRSCLLEGRDSGTLLCHALDVTEERALQQERQALEQRVREAEKLEAVGRVAANIAHDVNNVLMSIVSMAEYLQGEVPPGSAAVAEVEALIEAAWRGGRLMRGLLGLSKPSVRPRRTVEVGALLQQVAGMCRHAKPSVGVTLEQNDGGAAVEADEDELLQALLNLGKNAIEATAQGQVTLSCRRLDDVTPPQVEVVIRDTGSGMDPATLKHATEPLFTTKSQSGGSGLGLTLAHRTVTSLGGTLTLESELGRGTAVTLRVPLSADRSRVSESRVKTAVPTLKVLLVDDDPATRAAVKRQLLHGKAAVHDFADGPSAYRALETGLPIDVAVVDVNMPIWSGPQLVERLLELYPQLPVLFITGASGELIPEWMLRRPRSSLLRKPWPRDALLTTISSLTSPAATPQLAEV